MIVVFGVVSKTKPCQTFLVKMLGDKAPIHSLTLNELLKQQTRTTCIHVIACHGPAKLTSELGGYYYLVPFEELDNRTRIQPVQESRAKNSSDRQQNVGWRRQKCRR